MDKNINEIKYHLGNSSEKFNIIYFDEIDSTNSFGKRECEKLCHNTVIIADKQTNGRGRQGRSFHSPRNNGIYMSIIAKKEFLPKDISLITIAVASCVCRAIEKLYNIKVGIKWVNDIFVNSKKICGILCENALDSIIIGIGVNTGSTDDFPDELKGIAGALNIDSEEKNRLISEILNEFLKLDSENYYKKDLEYYREKSIVLGRNIMYIKNGEEKKAYVREINEKGNLVVINEKGEESVILSGEIRLGIDNIL